MATLKAILTPKHLVILIPRDLPKMMGLAKLKEMESNLVIGLKMQRDLDSVRYL